MTTTSVPSLTFASTGVSAPLESAILSGVFTDIDTAFGGGVNKSLTTPQGQLAQSISAIVGDKNDQISYVVNNLDPDVASGSWQDAIGRIYFIDRIAAAGTVVSATCGGLVGTVIPAGAVAMDSNGYKYAATGSVTIGSGGTATVQFQNLTTGAIPCGVGALNTIYTAVTGWETVTNAAAGSLGNDVESRAAFEARRRASVAIGGKNTTQSILANVLSVPNVIDAYVVDNKTSAPVSTGSTSYSIPANSLYIAVSGGDSTAVANAIWQKLPPGIPMAGNTTITVYDTSYTTPQPQYSIKFNVPTAVPVYVTVNIPNNSGLPMDINAQVRAAVIKAFNGQDGGVKARIGGKLYATRFMGGVYGISSAVQVNSIKLGTSSGSVTLDSLSFGIDQVPTISESNIAVNLV